MIDRIIKPLANGLASGLHWLASKIERMTGRDRTLRAGPVDPDIDGGPRERA